METYQKVLEYFNIKGGPLMGIWTLLMIILTAAGTKIDSGAITAYLGALAAYGVSKGHGRYLEYKQQSVSKTMEKGDI